jgi:hypothetical protein
MAAGGATSRDVTALVGEWEPYPGVMKLQLNGDCSRSLLARHLPGLREAALPRGLTLRTKGGRTHGNIGSLS